jgi:hypothetical protein
MEMNYSNSDFSSQFTSAQGDALFEPSTATHPQPTNPGNMSVGLNFTEHKAGISSLCRPTGVLALISCEVRNAPLPYTLFQAHVVPGSLIPFGRSYIDITSVLNHPLTVNSLVTGASVLECKERVPDRRIADTQAHAAKGVSSIMQYMHTKSPDINKASGGTQFQVADTAYMAWLQSKADSPAQTSQIQEPKFPQPQKSHIVKELVATLSNPDYRRPITHRDVMFLNPGGGLILIQRGAVSNISASDPAPDYLGRVSKTATDQDLDAIRMAQEQDEQGSLLVLYTPQQIQGDLPLGTVRYHTDRLDLGMYYGPFQTAGTETMTGVNGPIYQAARSSASAGQFGPEGGFSAQHPYSIDSNAAPLQVLDLASFQASHNLPTAHSEHIPGTMQNNFSTSHDYPFPFVPDPSAIYDPSLPGGIDGHYYHQSGGLPFYPVNNNPLGSLYEPGNNAGPAYPSAADFPTRNLGFSDPSPVPTFQWPAAQSTAGSAQLPPSSQNSSRKREVPDARGTSGGKRGRR